MEGSTAVISSNNKDVLMGEAYGLRAYLHFDLFRLFGPRWEDRSNINKILPYSRTTDMILNHIGYEEDVYSTADEYLDYLLEQIYDSLKKRETEQEAKSFDVCEYLLQMIKNR